MFDKDDILKELRTAQIQYLIITRHSQELLINYYIEIITINYSTVYQAMDIQVLYFDEINEMHLSYLHKVY